MIQPGSSTMRTWLQWCLRAVEFLAAGLYGFVILERCNQDGIWAVWGWVTAHGVFFFIGVLALTCAYGFVRAFFKRPFVPFALYGGLICFAGLGHYYKLYYRTEPLVPHDVFNAGPAFAIAGRTGLFLNRGLLLNFLLYAVCLLVAWLIPKYLYQPIKGRFAAVRVALVALASAAFLIFLANIPTLEAFGAVDMRYDQYQNYQYNGFVLSTLMNLADSRVEKPLNYDAATINALAEEIDGMEDPVALGKPQKQPHIIAIQMEAYGNPGLIDSRISYVNDPFAPLAPYSGEIQRFHTLTSVLGGGTANTEYEFLTGFNMVFCPAGVTPFIRYMNQPKPSLVKDLAAMGYQAVALHPHNASFYNRAAAFPRLGFTRFVTMEEFDDPVYIGYYISDGSFGTKVVELYEEERDKGPLFLFAISIQNHGPYSFPETYRAYPVCLSGGLAMDENQIMELETYGANIHDSSVMLANLIGYFSQTDEPVLLLVFGDHQASWSWSLNLPPNPELDLRRYSTESFFWANYPLEVDERTLVSASGLGPLMMRKAGLSLPRYEKGIHLQFDAMMAYNIAITVENDGSARYIDRDMMEAYRLLQYDRMFGADYLDRSRD